MKAKLLTRGGELVLEFTMPEFQLLPEVVLWGARIFILRHPFDQAPGKPAAPDYFEACGWSADASLAFDKVMIDAMGVQGSKKE